MYLSGQGGEVWLSKHFCNHVHAPPPSHTLASQFGATEFLNPKDYDRPTQQVLIEKMDGGLDYTFECVGNVETMVGRRAGGVRSGLCGWRAM